MKTNEDNIFGDNKGILLNKKNFSTVFPFYFIINNSFKILELSHDFYKLLNNENLDLNNLYINKINSLQFIPKEGIYKYIENDLKIMFFPIDLKDKIFCVGLIDEIDNDLFKKFDINLDMLSHNLFQYYFWDMRKTYKKNIKLTEELEILKFGLKENNTKKNIFNKENLPLLILNAVSNSVVVVDSNKKITFINHSAASLLNIHADFAINKNIIEIIKPTRSENRKKLQQNIDKILSGELIKTSHENELIANSVEKKLEIEYEINALEKNGQINGLIFTFNDIEEKNNLNKQLKKQAFFDNLTEIPNRTFIRNKIHEMLILSSFAVLYINLDHFKDINNNLGQKIGDMVLKSVTNNIINIIENNDIIGREGSDQFIVALKNNKDDDSYIFNKIENILTAINLPLEIKGNSVHVTASIGVSFYPEYGLDEESLINNASEAMYLAKRKGGNRYEIFTQELHNKNLQKFSIIKDLRTAVNLNQFEVYYQGQMCLRDNKINHAEALLRWNHPKLGFLNPEKFIEIAEESGLIVLIGDWVLDNVCKQIKEWHNKYGESPKIAINVSAQQLNNDNFVNNVYHIIKRNNISPEYIELELTEHSITKKIELEEDFLFNLKKEGLNLILDDFGTGYSNILTLSQMPFDVLKIDKSFIQKANDGEKNLSLIKMIVTLAKNLNLKIIAEGVEKEDQRDIVKNLGCHLIQGFLYSKPIPAKEFENKYLK